jgi:capsular polysaccharide biosynthesis protein
MDLTVFFKQMWQKKVTVVIITVFVFLLTIAITLTQPLKYSVTSKLLVVQSYNAGTDAYGIARSNQYLSNVLAQVVYSDAFYDQVMNSGFNISASYFPTNDVERRKFWLKMIDSRAIGDTGMIEVITYHQDKRFADQVNRAIAYILQTKNNEYHGLGDKVRVKVINNSMASVWPVKPNLLLNSFFGLFLGLVLSACYIKIWPDHEIVIAGVSDSKTAIPVPAAKPASQAPVAPIRQEPRMNGNGYGVAPASPAAPAAPQVSQASREAPTPVAPANLPVPEPAPANPFLQGDIRKFDGDIANVMK